MTELRFWLVWNAEGRAVSRYFTRDDAEREATKLARVFADTHFYVLSVESRYTSEALPVAVYRFDEIPY